MRSVANECNSLLGADPCRQGVTIDEFPVNEVVCWCRFDDLLYDWVPSFDDFETILDLARGGPGFFNICVILVDVRICLAVFCVAGKLPYAYTPN